MITCLHLSRGEGLAILDLALAVLLDPNALNRNETGSVLRCPLHIKRVHATLVLGVEIRGLAGAANNVSAALIGDEVDLALYLALRELDGVLDELTFGRKVHA